MFAVVQCNRTYSYSSLSSFNFVGEYLLPRDNFAVTMVETFFDDIFVVDGQDPGGKKFDKGISVNVSLNFSLNYSV